MKARNRAPGSPKLNDGQGRSSHGREVTVLRTVLLTLCWLMAGISSAPAQEPVSAKAERLAEAGQWLEAEAAFRELELRQNLTPDQLDRALEISGRLNHWDRVVQLLHKFRSRAPLSAGQRVQLYEALLKIGEKGKAEAELQGLRRDYPGNEYFAHLLAFLHLSQERFAEAVQVYLGFLEERPEAIESRVNLALVLFKLQRGDEALEQLSRAFKLDFTSANQFFYRQLVRNMPPEGLADLAEDVKTALRIPSDGIRTHLHLAREFENLKRYDPAILHYRAYLEAEPSHEEARLALAKLYFRVGDDAQCEALLGPLIESSGNFGDSARMLAAELAVRSGRFERAQELLEALPASFRREPLFLYFSARVALHRGEDSAAAELLRDVIRLDPDMAEPYFHLAQLELRKGNIEEGKRLMQEFQGRQP